jgi:hypothetical protein
MSEQATRLPSRPVQALPVLPSLVAMMLPVPVDTAVTRPVLEFTVATAVLLELQATARPVSVFPFASSVVAVACEVPAAVIDVGARATVTVATGASDTAIDDVPVFPSLVAVIVALPAPADATNPFASTVATARLLDVQVTRRPVSTLLFASFSVAVNGCADVMPRTIFALGGLTVTVATGANVTVSKALPVLPSLAATMFAVPTFTAVTTPLDPTLATPLLSELHTIARPVRARPLPSSGVAVAWVV